MSIEIRCSGCGQMLRVQEENAGKRGRCPECKTEFTIPSFDAPRADTSPAKPVYGNEPAGASSPFKPGQNPFSDNPAPQANPYASPQQHFPQAIPRTGYRLPHRGGTILTLGILAIFCNVCFIPGACAWSMGNNDLNAMRAGRMDPSGRGMTQAGQIMGIIGTVLSIILLFGRVAILGGR